MIRVFNANDRDFTTNGNGVIVPIKARVKNSQNGDFYFELTAESIYNNLLQQDKLLIVPTPQGLQPFRISNNITKKGNRITLKAYHVFYDSNNYVIADAYAVNKTCDGALKWFNNATDNRSPFTVSSDNTHVDNLRIVRKSLYEAIGEVVERWGGYLVRDGWSISVKNSIARDNQVTIAYKKNLQELTATYDFTAVVTKALPVGKDGILLPELYINAPVSYNIPYTKVIPIDQEIEKEDYSTEEAYTQAVIADLRTQATKYVNQYCYPQVTYTLKGKPEKVSDIGDVIRVHDERIGVDITTQVIAYEYDVISGNYTSLTFGNFGESLGNLMGSINSSTKAIVNEEVGKVSSSVNNIMTLLQGSYVIYRGYDILLCDHIPLSTASHILRFSDKGITVSTNGINGTFKDVYNLETERLSVPYISLNGADLGTTISNLTKSIKSLQNNKQDRLRAGHNMRVNKDFIETTASVVIANPSKTPTAVLSSIEIEGIVYELAGHETTATNTRLIRPLGQTSISREGSVIE